MNLPASRVVLAFVNASAPLTADEYARIREAGKYLAIINENIQQEKPPFEGLDFRQRQDLLAYVIYTRENSFTDSAHGDTPVEDSVRDLIRRSDMFRDEEGPSPKGDDPDKEFLNEALVTQLNKLRQKPLVAKLEVDDKGKVTVPKD